MSAPFVLLPGNARWVCTLVVCALLGNSTAAPPARFTLRPEAAFHPKRLLIKPRQAPAGATVASQLAVVHQAQGIQVRRKFAALGGLELLELPAAGDMAATVESYRASGLVEYAEPDYQVRIAKSPNDPAYQFGSLWAWHNTGQSLGVDDADIDAPEGWDRRTDASSIIVAVIDTGIRTTHEDLKGNLWTNPGEIPGNGRDDDLDGFIDDLYGINAITRSGNPSDDHGHGTHVAGIIGAVGDNGRGVVGVAWRVKLMALKFLDAAGNGYESDAITCIDYARAHGAKVINCSWGGGGFSQALADAVQSAAAAGIVIVAAAGNGSSDNDVAPFYPASYGSGNVLAVAATTRWDDLASFSNFGQGSVAVGAPGVEIFSTSYYGDSSYMPLSGTSMAAPVVSGILALMRAEFSGKRRCSSSTGCWERLIRSPPCKGSVRREAASTCAELWRALRAVRPTTTSPTGRS
ncbi:MAG: S8 family peptidase [Verrucomicrobiota bacterium]